MPCCLIFIFALLFPRVILVATWIVNPTFILDAYNGWVLPLIGLVFLPMTTLAYAWAVTFEGGAASIAGIVVVALGVLYDLGSHGGGTTGMRENPANDLAHDGGGDTTTKPSTVNVDACRHTDDA